MEIANLADYNTIGIPAIKALFQSATINPTRLVFYKPDARETFVTELNQRLSEEMGKYEESYQFWSAKCGKVFFIENNSVKIEGSEWGYKRLKKFKLNFLHGESLCVDDIIDVRISMRTAAKTVCLDGPDMYLFEKAELYEVYFFIVQAVPSKWDAGTLYIFKGSNLIETFAIDYTLMRRSGEIGRFSYIKKYDKAQKVYEYWLYNYGEHYFLGTDCSAYPYDNGIKTGEKGFNSMPAEIKRDNKVSIVFHKKNTKAFEVLFAYCTANAHVQILPNIFKDDDTENYIANFDCGEVDKLFFVCKCLSTRDYKPRMDLLYSSSFAGYAVYGIPTDYYWQVLREKKDQTRAPFWMLDDKGYEERMDMLSDFYGVSKYPFSLQEFPPDLPWLRVTSDAQMYSLNKYLWTNEQLLHLSVDEARKIYNDIYTQLLADGKVKARWISEYNLYEIVQSLFPDAIYQYHSEWLKHQSIDVYIPSIKVGLEYQGIQHYQPIEYFGGKGSFITRVELDARKRKLCLENGVRLIEIKYDQVISRASIKKIISRTVSTCEQFKGERK